jgi:hypothetical protein
MGSSPQETRQFEGGDTGYHQARLAGCQWCEECAGDGWVLLRD